MKIGQELKDKIMIKFNAYKEEAKRTLQNVELTQEKLNSVFAKAEKLNINTGPINKAYQDILLFIQIVRAWITKEYREIPTGSIIAIFGALIYFLSPIDILFDYIPGVGYVDDMFIIGLLLKQLDSDLQNFRIWKENNDSQQRIPEERISEDENNTSP